MGRRDLEDTPTKRTVSMTYWSYPLKTLDGGGGGGCNSPQTPKGSCQGYFQPGMGWKLLSGSGGSWRVALGSFSFRDLEVSSRGASSAWK